LKQFCRRFGQRSFDNLTSDDILSLLNQITEGKKNLTRKIRYSQLSTFFNFIHNEIDPDFQNPCATPMLRKLFRAKTQPHWDILEKDTVDEVIFRTSKPRNRLILELMARGGMRIGEVLKLRSNDVQGRKLILREPKSGREREFVYIPQKVADRLKNYADQVCERPDSRIFPISYESARKMVIKAGRKVEIHLRPHDLRRHSATFASRSGVPIEIVSKVILRHSNLSTTQRYLGKISDTEAMRWIENLYG
jgi:integrase